MSCLNWILIVESWQSTGPDTPPSEKLRTGHRAVTCAPTCAEKFQLIEQWCGGRGDWFPFSNPPGHCHLSVMDGPSLLTYAKRETPGTYRAQISSSFFVLQPRIWMTWIRTICVTMAAISTIPAARRTPKREAVVMGMESPEVAAEVVQSLDEPAPPSRTNN